VILTVWIYFPKIFLKGVDTLCRYT
jgi:hypothetical protein